MIRKPLIFVTNDDGIRAPGLRTLIRLMREFGKVVVVAPDKPQSGTAHSITVKEPLRLEEVAREKGYKEYACNGTPADCVKLGFKIVLKGHPDLLVSGINHGSNASINIIYSGTMAGVIEGAMAGVPAIGFSLDNYLRDADFMPVEKYIRSIVQNALEKGLPDGTCLNVNIPDGRSNAIKGIRICRQSGGTWQEDFDERVDPKGHKYYWLKGNFLNTDNKKDTDQWALENKWISIVPVQFDFTDHHFITKLKSWKLNDH